MKRLNKLLIVSLIFILACSETPVPKPSGYYRIDLPKQAYQNWESEFCPFSFRIAQAAKVAPSKKDQKCFFNLEYPQFNATVYLSYVPINEDLKALIDQEYTMREKHNAFSTGVKERLYQDSVKKVNALLFDVEGIKAATPLQFFITDSTHHFFRGALYFYNTPNNDSLAPVISFIKRDIDTLVTSFAWK